MVSADDGASDATRAGWQATLRCRQWAGCLFVSPYPAVVVGPILRSHDSFHAHTRARKHARARSTLMD